MGAQASYLFQYLVFSEQGKMKIITMEKDIGDEVHLEVYDDNSVCIRSFYRNDNVKLSSKQLIRLSEELTIVLPELKTIFHMNTVEFDHFSIDKEICDDCNSRRFILTDLNDYKSVVLDYEAAFNLISITEKIREDINESESDYEDAKDGEDKKNI